jgi:hypothetical protein
LSLLHCKLRNVRNKGRHNLQSTKWPPLVKTLWLNQNYTLYNQITCIPPIADPMRTPHFDLSKSFMTSSVIPASITAFFPAVRRYSINLSMRLANFPATQPSVENDLISPANLCHHVMQNHLAVGMQSSWYKISLK